MLELDGDAAAVPARDRPIRRRVGAGAPARGGPAPPGARRAGGTARRAAGPARAPRPPGGRPRRRAALGARGGPRGGRRRGPRRGGGALRAALEVAGDLPPARRAELLEALSVEEYTSGDSPAGLVARDEAQAIRRGLGDREAEGVGERWRARLLWIVGRRAEAEEAAERAVAAARGARPRPGAGDGLQHALPAPHARLARARRASTGAGGRSRWPARPATTRSSSTPSRTSAPRAAPRAATPARASWRRPPPSRLRAGFHDHAARALVNLAWSRVARHSYREGLEAAARGLEVADRFDLRSHQRYLLGVRAWAHLDTGDWAGAERDADASLADRRARRTTSSHHPALLVQARLRARRGDPAGGRAARAGVALRGDGRRGAAAGAGGDRARRARVAGRRRSRRPAGSRPTRSPRRPHGGPAVRGGGGVLAVARGRPRRGAPRRDRAVAPLGAGRRAGRGRRVGGPGATYLAADALAASDDPDDAAAALAVFDRLGAARSAAVLRARMRERGRGGAGRPAGGAGPHGLTGRQREVLELVAEGLTNAPDRRAPGDLGADGGPPRGRGAPQAGRRESRRGRRRARRL